MTVGRAVAGVASALAVTLALGACVEDPSPTSEAEAQVLEALADRFEDPDDVRVTCPEDLEIEAGSSLVCDLAVGDAEPQAAAFDINEDDIVVLTSAVIPTADVEDYLVGELTTPAEGTVEVSCGDTPLLIGAVGDVFPCESVRVADGAGFIVNVEVTTIDGTVRYQVVPMSTTVPAAPTSVPAP